MRSSEVKDLAIKFAEETYKLHTTKCDTDNKTSCEKLVGDIVHYVNGLNFKARKVALYLLRHYPETNTMLYGDLLTQNLINFFEGKNNNNTEEIFYGNPIFDFASLYYLFCTSGGKLKLKRISHLSNYSLALFWDTFIIAYASLSKQKYEDLITVSKLSVILYYIRKLNNPKIIKPILALRYKSINLKAEEYDF